MIPADEKKRALVIDDSAVMRAMIANILNADGFVVVGQASDGPHGAQLARELKPDLVTLDLVMPGEMGFETLRQIMHDNPQARVMIVSGLHQKALLAEATQLGATGFLVKPFTSEELLDVATKCTSR